MIFINNFLFIAVPFEQRVVIKSAHKTMIQFSSSLKTKSNNPINNNNIAQQHDLLKRNPEKNLDEVCENNKLDFFF